MHRRLSCPTPVSVPGVVVVGGHINALGLVRALAAHGVPTAVVTTEPFDLAHRSNVVSGWAAAPQLAAAPAQLREVLAARPREWAGWALLPSNDSALVAIDAEREWLESRYPLCAPPAGTVARLIDKASMRREAARAGLALPAHYGAATTDNPQLPHIAYPVVVKPHTSLPFSEVFGCKLFVVRDRAALDVAIARVQAAGIACDIDQWIDGGDDQIVAAGLYFTRTGDISNAVFARKIRQGPPFAGVARVAELATDDFLPPHEARRLRDAVIALLQPLGFHGTADAEFKRDARSGTWYFIEVNCRSVLYNSLLRRGGLDFAVMAYTELTTGQMPKVTPTRWPGVWVNLHADLLYSVAYHTRDPMSLRRFLAPYRRPVIDAVWSRHDPRPFLSQWAHTAGRVPRALRDRLSDR